MFKTVMITMAILVALGWLAYGIWTIRERIIEKKNPKPQQTTEHLKKVGDSFAEYAKKLQNDKRKPYERR